MNCYGTRGNGAGVGGWSLFKGWRQPPQRKEAMKLIINITENGISIDHPQVRINYRKKFFTDKEIAEKIMADMKKFIADNFDKSKEELEE